MVASLFTNKTWSLSGGVMGKTHEILMAVKGRAQKLVAYLVRLQHITLPHTDVKWFLAFSLESAPLNDIWLKSPSAHASKQHWSCFHRCSTDTRVICSTSCALLFLIYYIFLSYIVFNVFVKLGLVVGCTALCFVVVCWVTAGLALFYLK